MSRIHLLDTNVLRAWVDGAHERLEATVARVAELGKTFVFLSAITVGEVEFGLARPHRLEEKQVAAIRSALSNFAIMAVDSHVAVPYGKLRAWLLEQYGPKDRRTKLRSLVQLSDPATDLELGIQENDLWLASQAIATDAVLVTGDKMERIVEAAAQTGQHLYFARW